MIVASDTHFPNTIATTVINLIGCDDNIQLDRPRRGLKDKENITEALHYKQTVDRTFI